MQNLNALAAVIAREKETVLKRWRGEVRELPSAKHLDTPTLNDHIPDLLDELCKSLRNVSDATIAEALLEGSPPIHGQQRFQDGFDIVEVVAEYNILRGCIHDLAESNGLSMTGKAFHILNRVLDEAIGLAVQTFATEQALEVQRRRDEYLALVAHDLRTPLSAIALVGGFLDLKLANEKASPDVSRMLKVHQRSVQHLTSLVENVLKENANLETESGVKLERRELDLWPLVESLIHDLHPVAGTGSTELINAVPDDLTAYADASLLRRIFQNLVANAIKYTPRGKVTVGAGKSGPNEACECWVMDDGAGIPEERLGKIFDKYETDPERPDGIGLGLAIVKTFVEAHGGTVTVTSTIGAGSTFRFTLPGKDEAKELRPG